MQAQHIIHGIGVRKAGELTNIYTTSTSALINNLYIGDLTPNTNPYYVFIPRYTANEVDGILVFKINSFNNEVAYNGSLNKQTYAYGNSVHNHADILSFALDDSYVYYPNYNTPRTIIIKYNSTVLLKK